MRTFIMLGVLSVHTIARFIEMIHTDMTPGLITLGTLITSLHFTRESFMFITGLVLFITYYSKSINPFQFWWKRLRLVAIPYLVWNVLYIFFESTYQKGFNWAPGAILNEFFSYVITGRQFYLYFIMVSIQFYVVFPFLLWALRKLERWHWPIFIGSFVLELFLMYLTKFYLPNVDASKLPGILSTLDRYRDSFLLTYQFWFVAGGIIASHYQKILSFVNRHVRLLWIVIGISVPIVWAHYLIDRFIFHESESLSQLVLQPIMIPYSLLISLGFWQAGVLWSRRRERPRWRRFSSYVQVASNTSFGMYLVQPIPLYYMEISVKHLIVPAWVHYFILLPLSVVFVYGMSMLLSYCIGKIPWVAYIVGRKVKTLDRRRGSIRVAANSQNSTTN
jgi:hypothetical protein